MQQENISGEQYIFKCKHGNFVRRCSSKPDCVADYSPCTNCNAYFILGEIWRHNIQCIGDRVSQSWATCSCCFITNAQWWSNFCECSQAWRTILAADCYKNAAGRQSHLFWKIRRVNSEIKLWSFQKTWPCTHQEHCKSHESAGSHAECSQSWSNGTPETEGCNWW